MVRRVIVVLLAAMMLVGTTASSSVAAQQRGLVNINVEDNTVQVPIAVAANICDVTVAVLAQDIQDGGATCNAVAGAAALSFAGGGNQGGQTMQEGLINVNLENNTVQIPIAAAANICDVTVLVLVQEILLSDATMCTARAGAIGIG
jgi:hypothetical protein